MDGTTDIAGLALSRRRFIVTGLSAAGGLAVGVLLPHLAKALPIAAEPWNKETAPGAGEVNAWIMIEPDESVVIRFARSEMGQGSFTALPMIVAEELECDWSKVRAEYASANRNLREGGVYRRMSTGGSRAVRESREYLQQAGASARVRLVAAAARRWNVPASECEARNGTVVHAASNRTLSYGTLAPEAAKIALDREPAIKTPDQFKLIGKPTARLDTPLKINGSAKFGIDARLPDMLYAAVAACPVFGGKL
ncbi:MAG TPA: molybdopterin cofactor-binding domain-containing protein, partial [Stellaceae bacterium]|nr:molybdopterin cofactor-binding domain-containing protein [Stellaceae bacterium]